MMGEDLATGVFLTFLLISALAVCLIPSVLYSVIIFGGYSLVMAVIWLQMNAPDIAITEAAAGIGMTTIMVAVILLTKRRHAR